MSMAREGTMVGHLTLVYLLDRGPEHPITNQIILHCTVQSIVVQCLWVLAKTGHSLFSLVR